MKIKHFSTLGVVGVASILTISCTRNLDTFEEYSPEKIFDDNGGLVNDVVFNAIAYSEGFSSEFDSLLDIYTSKDVERSVDWTSIFIENKIEYSINFIKSPDNTIAIDDIEISGSVDESVINEITVILHADDFFNNMEKFANLYSTGAEGKAFYRNNLLKSSPVWLRSNAVDLITGRATSNDLSIIYDYQNPPTWSAGNANTIYEMGSALNFDQLDDWIFNTFWKLDDEISFSTIPNGYEWFDFIDDEDSINHVNIPFNVFGEEIVVSKNIGITPKGISEIRDSYESMSIKTSLSLDEVMRLSDLSVELDSDTPFDVDGYYGLTSTFNGDGNILEQLSDRGIQLQRVKLLDTHISNKYVIELKVKEGQQAAFMRAEFTNDSW